EVCAAGFLRHSGQWVSWGAGLRFEEFGRDELGPWLGFQVPGADLDRILLRKAIHAGVTVLQPCRALAAISVGGRIAGVRCKDFNLFARFTIDASGRQHWLRAATGARMIHNSRRLVAIYGYSRGNCPEFSDSPVFWGTGDGWTWVAPLGPALYGWTMLNFGTPCREVPEALRRLSPAGPIRGADVTWRIVSSCAGPGYFITGDAGSVMDPAAAHGVLKALMSGILAADLTARVLAGKTAESNAARGFDQWTRHWHTSDVERLSAFYHGQIMIGIQQLVPKLTTD